MLDHELRETWRDLPIAACLGSSNDDGLVRALLRTQRVQTVYHAAAYKHVPIVESNMQQGLRNNVFGSLTIARAALETGAETCVLIAGFVHVLLRGCAAALDVTSAAPCLRHPALPSAFTRTRLHGC